MIIGSFDFRCPFGLAAKNMSAGYFISISENMMFKFVRFAPSLSSSYARNSTKLKKLPERRRFMRTTLVF